MTDRSPAWRLTVQKGCLVPADQYTEEQLSHFSMGSAVDAKVVRERGEWRRRKENQFYAVLDLVLKNCRTPWQLKSEAADALKVPLGFVDAGATITGKPARYPKSMTDIDDVEFADFFDGAMALLKQITGVDPLTLRKEADVTDDDGRPQEPESGVANLPTDEGGAEGEQPTPSSDGDPSVADAAGAPPLSPPNAQGAPAVDYRDARYEMVRKLMALADDPDLQVSERLEEIAKAMVNWHAALPGHANFLALVERNAMKVANGQLKGGSAKAYLLAMASEKKQS